MVEPTEERFSLVIGGPFYRLQQHLGLLGPDLLPPLGTALLFAVVAWVPPALLSLLFDGFRDEPLSLTSGGFFVDFTTYARYLLAITVLVTMERTAEERIAGMVRQVFAAGLLPADDQVRFRQALVLADARTSSAVVEWLLLALALGAAIQGALTTTSVMEDSWMGSGAGDWLVLSPAGWWALLVSLPLFWFLLLRWLWRFAVWALLLHELAGMRLRLSPAHPDQSGGLGFMSMYPPTFAGLVFALSCVTASAALEIIIFGHATLESMALPFAVWLGFVLVLFVGPITVFAGPLSRLKRRALLDYGVLASHHGRHFDALRRGEGDGEEAGPLGPADVSSVADLVAVVEVMKGIRIVPAGLDTLIPLVMAAGLPWLVVVATEVPLAEIVSVMAGALL